MSIAPVNCSVDVKAAPARAFDLFTRHMGAWWPRGRTLAGSKHVELVIEPKQDGRWFERDADGAEAQWGTVLAWEPPQRLVLGWQLNHLFRFDAQLVTQVEILFQELPDGGTRVSLEHRDLHKLGAEADVFAGKVRSGWPERLADFAQYATAHP